MDKLIRFKNLLRRPNSRWQEDRMIAISIVDKAINDICMRSVFSIRDLIRNEQITLYSLIVSNKDNTQAKFNFQMDFNHNGNVVTDPTFEEYTIHIMNLYESVRKVIVNEK